MACHNCLKPKSQHQKERFDGRTVLWCEGPGSETYTPSIVRRAKKA